jgi:hypothetical protein
MLRLAHHKCLACQTRFFDDAAMRRIQTERHQIAATRALEKAKETPLRAALTSTPTPK